MRHPEKSTPNVKEDNFDLKLSEHGIEQAHEMGQRLHKRNIEPDLIVASPANRTRTTAEIMAEELNYSKTIMYNEVLYQAFLNELLETISYTFDTVNELLLVGHNPSLTALVLTLVGHKEEVKPGMVLKIDFSTDSWINISKENANLIWLEEAK